MDHEVGLDRVVAVIAVYPGGRRRWGSGYLWRRDQVLTAWHCVADRDGSAEPEAVQVMRALDRQVAEVDLDAVVASHWTGENGNWGLDAALLRLKDPPWPDQWLPPLPARVESCEDREHG